MRSADCPLVETIIILVRVVCFALKGLKQICLLNADVTNEAAM